MTKEKFKKQADNYTARMEQANSMLGLNKGISLPAAMAACLATAQTWLEHLATPEQLAQVQEYLDDLRTEIAASPESLKQLAETAKELRADELMENVHGNA